MTGGFLLGYNIVNRFAGGRGGQFSKVPQGSFGVGVWKDIRREAQQLKQES